MHIPRYFAEDRARTVEQRNGTIQTVLDRLHAARDDPSASAPFKSFLPINAEPLDSITLAHAVRVLQAHERARQGRVHAYFMRRMKNDLKKIEAKVTKDVDLAESCLVIQTVWRQRHASKVFNARKTAQTNLLGMVSSVR